MLAVLSLTACSNPDMKTLQKYVLVQPGQVRNLRVKGSDFQETYLVMRFESRGDVSFPAGPNLRLTTRAEAQAFAVKSECAADLAPGSDIQYATVPQASTNTGRLVVKNPQGEWNAYCVVVLNTDR